MSSAAPQLQPRPVLNCTIPYKPLPHQRRFHDDRTPYRLLRGGVGSGKTLAGAAESIRLAIANPQCDGLIVAPTWGILHRTTLRTFVQLLPKPLLARQAKSERYLQLVNGSRVYYGSADRPDTLEGANLAWAWGDEGRYWSREAWQILIARVRAPSAQHRSIVVTSTPSMNWLYDVWGEQRIGYADHNASTADNPYLPAEYDAALRRSYSEALYRQYAGGEWGIGEGQVFPEFDTAIHCCPGLTPGANATVDLAIDLGVRRPAVVYLQGFNRDSRCPIHTDNTECVHIVGEFLPNDCPTYQLAWEIRYDLQRRGWLPGVAYIDPAGANRDIQTGRRDVEVLEGAGFRVEYSHDPVMRSVGVGTEHLRALLRPVEGSPKLYIDSHLAEKSASPRGIVRAFARAEKDEKREGRTYRKDGELDHVLDCLRYGVNHLIAPVGRGIEVF